MKPTHPTSKPPTEREIEDALDVISRAAKARKASGQDRPKDQAFHRYWEQKRTLAAACDETAQSLYPHIADALPDNRKEIFSQYSLLLIAPCSITPQNIKFFQSLNRKAKNLLSLQGS